MNLSPNAKPEANRAAATKYLESDALGPARIPRHMIKNIVGYVCDGWRIGDFLTGVFSNSLIDAGSRADTMNRAVLGTYALMLCQCPRMCYGDAERVSYWQSVGGLNGRIERTRCTELPHGKVSVMAFRDDDTKVEVRSAAGATTILIAQTGDFLSTAIKIVAFVEGHEYDSGDPAIGRAIHEIQLGLEETVPQVVA